MDLRGTKIRDFFHLGSDIHAEDATARLFKIPHYQRPYVWEPDRVSALVNDLFSHNDDTKDNSNSKYFAGAIVTVVNENYHALIDGQQRYTTIYLANYIRFLLFRSYFEQAIKSRHFSAWSRADSFSMCSNYVFEKEVKGRYKEELNRLLGEAFDDKSKTSSIASKFQNFFNMPTITPDQDLYSEQYRNLCKKMISVEGLLLSYNRSASNENLKKALTCMEITLTSGSGPELKIHDNDDSSISNYLGAAAALFEQFENEARSRGGKDEWEQNSMVRTERMLDQIQFFLENLQVCVVQTGKEEDAYTLFEVLNDRALSLNDLDIVKNYFYRTYVLQNSIPGQEGIVESTLDSMEELWSGRIFSDGTQEFLKSNTAYLGTIFLTGDKELTDVKGPRLRESIKGYLDRCGKSYSAGELSEDFRAFQLIQYFLKSCGITHQKKENAAIDSIANKDASEIKRAVLILQALGLTAVLPGIVSPAINRAMTNDDNDRESWLDKLINHDTAKASFPELEKFAFYLINYVLAANDYKRPRKLVSDHFIHDWRKGNSPQTPPWDLARPSSTEIGSFNEWSSSWQYSQKGPGFRLRALLTRLVRAQLHGDKLKMGMAFTEFPPAEKLQLDHLEPARANASHSNSYLQHPERQRLVNGLGNMMLIDSSNNIQKSNSPMRDCFAHLKAAGLNDNWLVNELRQLFDINCQTNAGGDKVPTAEFFVARGARLRSLMATVLNADFEEKELKVEMLD